jgi:energy-coupling factor transporter ATP-binding protein EcfA2
MLDINDKMMESMEKSCKRVYKNTKKMFYKNRDWEIPFVIDEVIERLWGDKRKDEYELIPFLVLPERPLSIGAEGDRLRDRAVKFFKSVGNRGKFLYLPALKTSYGWQFIWHLPPGYRDADLLNAEPYFYTALGRKSINFEIKDAAIFMYVAKENLKNFYPYEWDWSQYNDHAIPLPLGITYTGLFVVDIADGPFGILWGPAGSGKTTALRTITTGVIESRPDDVDVIIVDTKKADFQFAGRHALLLNDIKDITLALEFLIAEMDRRADYLVKHRCESVKVLNQRYPDRKLRYYFLVVDEFAQVAEKSQRCADLIDELWRIGRYVGITGIVASQRMTRDISVKIGSIKNNCNLKMGYHMSPINSRLLFDESEKAAMIPQKVGRGVIQWFNKLVEYQGMDLTLSQAEQRLKKVPAREVKLIGTATNSTLPARQGAPRAD